MPTSSDDGGDKPSGPADPTNPEQSVISDENTGEGDGDNAENGNGFGKEGDVPGTDNGDTGTGADADVDAPEQPALSEPAANKPVDDSDNEHQLTLYVGEVRDCTVLPLLAARGLPKTRLWPRLPPRAR